MIPRRKLSNIMKYLKTSTITPLYLTHYDSEERSRIILTRYATGSHCLEEGTGRWRNVDKNSRTCKVCEDDVENLTHFQIDCPKLAEIRCKYTNFPNSVKEFFKWQLCPTVIGYLHRDQK